jgi:pimeloyl-ACP methyl ester carboxylesterase
MERAKLNGIELEYEVKGSGEPLLLIGPGPFADSFLPLLTEPALEAYRLVRYRQRGQAGSPRGPEPVSFAVHAADAAALLGYLGIGRAHVAGHSTGASIALQLATDRPDLVDTLVLLEPPLMGVAGAADFLERIAPALAAFGEGDGAEAMVRFLTVACSLDRETCRRVVESQVPGGMAQAEGDAHNFFGSYLPALGAWSFGAAEAARFTSPVLFVRGTETDRLFAEGRDLLHAWLPQTEDFTVDGVGHLLHVQRPAAVAQGIADFLVRHPMQLPEMAAGR